MSSKKSREGYVTCPYEVHHQILISRLQFHLVKCKKVYKGEIRLSECPFNSTHKIPDVEMNCHKMYLCPDRYKLDSFIYATDEDSSTLFPIQNQEVETSENWDDINHPSYDPMEHCKNLPILTTIQGATPSERKQYRELERQRLQKLTSGNYYRQTEASNKTSAPPTRLPQSRAQSYVERNGQNVPVNENNPALFGRGRGRFMK